ncbi:MAG: hypothetical protein WBL15_10720 [Phycisphaerae bacterium]
MCGKSRFGGVGACLLGLVAPVMFLVLPLATARAGQPRTEEVIIVFKTHFDIGYTDMAVNVVEGYRTSMIDQALAVVDDSHDLPAEQQFVWTIPGWPMHKILDPYPGQNPQRRQRILEAFKAGRFAVHALPFTTHTELLELEDLVRGLTFSSRLTREAGLPLPRDAKMTDVPCHTWSLVTLLKHAGVDFLHLGCNAASSSPQVPPLFWWEGPDGSRLLTMYSAAGYGTGIEPPKDWPYRAWLALIHTGDNHGPPTPEEVNKLLTEAKEKLPGVKVRIGRLSDFAEAVLADKPDLPVIRGDMPDTWIHGPMSDPYGAFTARTARPKIAAAEAINMELQLWGVNTMRAEDAIAAAYELSLLYGEHTWGGSLAWIKPFFGYDERFRRHRALGVYQRIERSWNEHTQYIVDAADLSTPPLVDGHAFLARHVKVEGGRVVVYNPLPWTRSAVAMAVLPKTARIKGLRPADSPAPVAFVPGESVCQFFAEDIPAFGYRTFVPAEPAPPPATGVNWQNMTIESPFFKVRLDPQRGAIASLIDKRSGRELVDAGAPYGFGQYLYERFDADQTEAFRKAYVKIDTAWARNEFSKPDLPPASEAPYKAASLSNFKVHLSETPLVVSAELTAQADENIPTPVTLSVYLNRQAPYVDLSIRIQDKPADSWPEAGWLCLPFKVDEPRFRLGRLGSIIDPTRDVVPGSNRHLFALSTGLTITNPNGQGAGLCPLASGLVSLDTPGCWKYSLDFVPRKPIVFVNLFNNQWTTNFRLWNEGIVLSTVRIWAVENENPESSLITPSLEALHTFPLMGAWFEGPAGKLPPSQAGVELSRKGILVTSFGVDPDALRPAPGSTQPAKTTQTAEEAKRLPLVLRLWELAGKAGPVEVRLPAGLRPPHVQPVNLRGETTDQPIPVKDGVFTVNIGAFAPASVRIERQ